MSVLRLGPRGCCALLALVCAHPTSQPASAQQGAIAGRVTDAATLVPVPLARVSVVGGQTAAQVISESDGSFELRLDPGSYDLLVEAGDFAPTRFDRIRVSPGQTTARNLPLESQGYRLAGFIVTASRGTVDTEITAPSSSHSISALEISERPAPSPVEHLRDFAAVDIMTQGIQSSNVVVRGFNNIFSGALHMLTDNRLAGLPSLRVNLMHFLPSNDLDVDRTEVVSGAGSALYGPNTANGVLHVITESPLESQGTTVTLGAGERSLVQGAFRTAFLIGEDLGVKVSGQVLRGEEWPYVDSEELTARRDADDDPETCQAERETRGLTPEQAEAACDRIGNRDYGLRRYALEARADWRFSRRGTFATTYGRTQSTGIELTPLGAAQTDGWVYQFVQGRLMYDRWFIQGYFNANDAGGAFLLRDGVPLVDRSTLGGLQIQNGFALADGRFDFTYGWDYFSTHPDSRGTIYGAYEDHDAVREWGLYLQSKTALSRKVDLIVAGRVDSHSILTDKVYSPRVAVVFKPNDANALRVAYNRAFTTPTALNYFLDINAGSSGGFGVRAFGTGPNGFGWYNPDGSLRGMRSPFTPEGAGGPGQLLPVDRQTLWLRGLDGLDQLDLLPPEVTSDVLDVLRQLEPDSVVGIRYRSYNEEVQHPLSALDLPDVPPIQESTTETLEVGWSGVLRNSLRVSADLYYMRRNDFVSPLVVETPLLHLSGTDLAEWMGPAYVDARIEDLVARGQTLEDATAQAAAEAAVIVGPLSAGFGQLPQAVVTSDVPEMESGSADLIATYRNVGEISLWGADVTVQWSLTPQWTLSASYSHVSDNWFTVEGAEPIALNAPADKGTFGIGYRDEALGVNASARVRVTDSFPALATQFAGTVDAYALLDLAVGYKVPRTAATVQLGVSNLLDTGYRSFVGVPAVGRLAIARVRYDFF